MAQVWLPIIILIFHTLTATAADKCGPAPVFALRNLKGDLVDLESLARTPFAPPVTLVSFFQTTCLPCLEEIKYLLKQKANGVNFTLVLISFKEERAQVAQFIREKSFGEAVVLIDTYGKLEKPYGLGLFPKMAGISGKGRLLFSLEGKELKMLRERDGLSDLLTHAPNCDLGRG